MAAFLVASSSEPICKFFSFLNYSPRENFLKYVDLNEISLKICKKNNIYYKCFFIIEKKVKTVFPSHSELERTVTQTNLVVGKQNGTHDLDEDELAQGNMWMCMENLCLNFI